MTVCLQVAVLRSLDAKDIGEVIRKTKLLNTAKTVMQAMELREGDQFHSFCEAIKELSGGIPLFVMRALQVGICHTAALLHEATLQIVTELLICRVLCTLSCPGNP